MPGMNGVDWCHQLKHDSKHKDISVISVSATKDVSLEFLKAGADDFIHKPYTKDEVVVKVNTQFRQITLEKQLKASIEKEQALNHQKNLLLGTAAHDLRNPVATIISYLSLVKDKKYEDEFTEMAIESSYRQAEKALELLNDILDVSSITSGTLSLELKPMNLEPLLEDRVKEMKNLGSKKNIEVEFENNLDEGQFANVSGDTRRLEQVVDNLLSNAIKYSHEGTCTRVKLSRCAEGWLVQVKDQGQGIPEDECEDVFSEFKKTSTKTTGGESSTGLGLAIVKKIIDAHNGFIWVESKIGEGSTFSFTLPVKD
jgi:signal transduction histidine kinase